MFSVIVVELVWEPIQKKKPTFLKVFSILCVDVDDKSIVLIDLRKKSVLSDSAVLPLLDLRKRLMLSILTSFNGSFAVTIQGLNYSFEP